MTLELAGAVFVLLLVIVFLAPNPAEETPPQPAVVVMPTLPAQDGGQSNVSLLLVLMLILTVLVLLITG
jgi:hypothetical protein